MEHPVLERTHKEQSLMPTILINTWTTIIISFPTAFMIYRSNSYLKFIAFFFFFFFAVQSMQSDSFTLLALRLFTGNTFTILTAILQLF